MIERISHAPAILELIAQNRFTFLYTMKILIFRLGFYKIQNGE